ncbi:MAG: helix-turn-helix domain-containing protein [Candidatus Bathyarchaeia archaeon]
MQSSLEEIDQLVRVYDDANKSWKFVKNDKGLNRQMLAIEENLSRLGLLKNEVRVYLHLARVGEKKAAQIAEAISLHRTETYRVLRALEKKGIVFSAFEKPIKFRAVPLEKAMDMLIEAQKMKIKDLEKEKPSLVSLWMSIPKPEPEIVGKEIFQILEGDQQMTLKANEILNRTTKELLLFAPSDSMGQLYNSDFLDNLQKHSNKLNVTILTDNSLKSKFFLEQMPWAIRKYRIVEVTNIPFFMVSDGKELLINAQRDEKNDQDSKSRSKVVILWTNYTAFVQALRMLFSKLNEMGRTFQQIYVKT